MLGMLKDPRDLLVWHQVGYGIIKEMLMYEMLLEHRGGALDPNRGPTPALRVGIREGGKP